jgi:tetratricopeptide (TPR) repeat protein
MLDYGGNRGAPNEIETLNTTPMDALITAAARALAAGDPLAALDRIALRDDATSLALRGIAMAQLGDLTSARTLTRRAAAAFGPDEPVAHARCVVAEVEIAFAARDLGWSPTRLDAARTVLEQRGDRANAAHAAVLGVRRLLILGRLDDAERILDTLDPAVFQPPSRAIYELVAAGIALRKINTAQARSALDRAEQAARDARIPALIAEVDAAKRALSEPAARLISRGSQHPVLLHEVETLQASGTLVVDACRNVVRDRNVVVSLATRPVLFTLARMLGEAWPRDVSRDVLVARAFGGRQVDESHRARLRVEIGRLRKELKPLVGVKATHHGFTFTAPDGAHSSRDIVVLLPPVEDNHAALLALLADGQSWSSSALALALTTSQRTVQRALDSLAAAGRAQSFGHGRSRRWITPPVPGFTTTLLLPSPIAP